MSLALELRGPQSLALLRQAPWEVPSGADLGLGLAPRRPAGPIRWLCGQQRGWLR